MEDSAGSACRGRSISPLRRPLSRISVAVQLTPRDHELFDALTRRVRLLSLAQVARTWWPQASRPARAAETRLRALAEDGLIGLSRELAHPELDLETPVISWTPGEAEPNFGSASFKLQSRWSSDPVRTLCVSATHLAARRFGGYGGRPSREIERTHDLHFSQVFLLYRSRHPELVPFWIFEEQIKAERSRRARGEKLPDAFLRLESGLRVIEFGGAYGKRKLQAFHHYCEEKSYPYEIW